MTKKIADFYHITAEERRAFPGSKGKVNILLLDEAAATRELKYTTYVTGKAEAREVARTFRAQPWNF